MKKSVCLFAIGILVAGAAVAQGAVESPAPKSDYVSPEFLAVSADAASVFATSATGAKILRVKLADGTTTSWTIASSQVKDTPVNPTGIAAANGSVYVTCGVQAGELQQYREDGTLVGTTCVGHSRAHLSSRRTARPPT